MESKEILNKKIKKILADQLGVESDDIQNDYSLTEDLHMGPTDISDFIENLLSNGVETGDLDMEEIETFDDLVDVLSLSQI